MKKVLILSISLILVIFLILFGNLILNNYKNNFNKYKIAFVMSGIGDNGFADMQVKGVKQVSKIYGIKYKLYITGKFEAIKDGIINAINDGCNIIISGNGFLAEKPILELAPSYPNIYFICMDTEFSYYPQNVATVSFKQNEGSFLVGVIAAKMTKTKNIGFIGGMNIPVINDFLVGFKQGINFVDNKLNIFVRYCDEIFPDNPFQNIEGGKEIATDMLNSKNVDVIYAVAGKANLGIYDAIKNINNSGKLVYAIGVDTDQDGILKGKILTSMIKNLDTAILYIIDRILNNKFENKNYQIGLKENGVSLSEMKYTKNLIGIENLRLIETLKYEIIDNKLKVETVYRKVK